MLKMLLDVSHHDAAVEVVVINFRVGDFHALDESQLLPDDSTNRVHALSMQTGQSSSPRFQMLLLRLFRLVSACNVLQ
jgi:hypothetical protein